MAERMDGTVDERLARAEAALAEALAERNRLWDELNRRKACEEELEHQYRVVASLTSSASWRMTAPLRRASRVSRDPLGAAKRLYRRIESRRAT